jgi:iduronate 2-sulfatase
MQNGMQKMGEEKRTHLLKNWGLIAAVVASLLASAEASGTKPNILFIAVDDLRTELGCYGSTLVQSPNIDRLASTGTLFERAYCQQSVCGPSRVSLLCGQRPDTTGVTSLFTKFRDIQPDIVTLPQFFKNKGYHSYRLGKIFHTGHGNSEDEISWSTMALGNEAKVKYLKASKRERPTVEILDVPDTAYSDGMFTEDAIKAMERFKKKDSPFFLAVGYKKPHLPFTAPKKYWDLYDRDAIPDSPVPYPPEGVFEHAMASFGEMRKYDGIPETGPVSLEQRKELRHGYLACVSYIDAQVGRLLDTLESTGLKDNTIVILWSDHGWKLNDYANWCKHSNMEVDVKVPLILSVPGLPGGQRSNALVELVDIYPTLAELCGFDIPDQCEGSSLIPLLNDPDRPWKSAAFSQYPRGSEELMGHSIRSGRWRYVEWIDVETGEIKDRELYDQKASLLATRNQSRDPELSDTVRRLSLLLDKGQGWRAIKREADGATKP